MATKGQRYDHPNFTIRREVQANNLTGIASTMFQRILFFQKTRIKAVHSLVITAGTNAAAGVDLFNVNPGTATNSVGAIVHGEDAAESINTSGVINTDIEANGYLELRGKATSATMVNSYSIECEVLPDAVNTI